MLISPPFLPARGAGQLDAAWVEKAMAQPPNRAPFSRADEGSFPLSAALMWHNGVHIQSVRVPESADWPAVRAIASGKIVYVSTPKSSNANATDPQNYNPFGSGTSWSDNGLVII